MKVWCFNCYGICIAYLPVEKIDAWNATHYEASAKIKSWKEAWFMHILGLIGLIILWGATFVAIFIFFLGLFYAFNAWQVAKSVL